jgi:hypothetical protein
VASVASGSIVVPSKASQTGSDGQAEKVCLHNKG